MDEEKLIEVENECEGDGVTLVLSNPEIVSTEGPALVHEAANRKLVTHFQKVVDFIYLHAEKGSLAYTKLLFELAAQVKLKGELPEETYRSFAEELFKACREMEAGNEEQL